MLAVVASGGAGLTIEELKEDGSTWEPSAFPFASASWKVLVPVWAGKVLVPVWAVEPSIAAGWEVESSGAAELPIEPVGVLAAKPPSCQSGPGAPKSADPTRVLPAML